MYMYVILGTHIDDALQNRRLYNSLGEDPYKATNLDDLKDIDKQMDDVWHDATDLELENLENQLEGMTEFRKKNFSI